MKEEKTLTPVFVEFVPDVLEDGKLYVSMEYATVVHRCCCGKEVVTPLSPTDWNLTFNGKGCLPVSVDRELELPLPIALLDQEQQDGMGRPMVAGPHRCRPGSRTIGQRTLF